MKQHDLRIRIQRTPSFQLGGDSTSPASPLPLHQSFGRDHTCASGASSTAAAHASNASQDTETPPTTPLCNGTFQLLGADLGAAVPGRRSLLRRNSSMSSVSSSVGGDDDDEMDEEWTEEEKERLRTAFDEAVESVDHAPFSQAGPPPSNLTHVVARNVIANAKSTRSAGPRAVTSGAEDASRNDAVQSWRHGLKSTRQKLLTLGKCRSIARVKVLLTRRPCSNSQGAPVNRRGDTNASGPRCNAQTRQYGSPRLDGLFAHLTQCRSRGKVS